MIVYALNYHTGVYKRTPYGNRGEAVQNCEGPFITVHFKDGRAVLSARSGAYYACAYEFSVPELHAEPLDCVVQQFGELVLWMDVERPTVAMIEAMTRSTADG